MQEPAENRTHSRPGLETVEKMQRRAAIERIREEAIVPVLEQLGATCAGGRRWRCWNKAAHAHGDRQPSATLYGAWFKCRAPQCGVEGDVFAMLQRAHNLSFPEAGTRAAAAAGLEWPSLGDRGAAASEEAVIEHHVAATLRQLAEWWASGSTRHERAREYWRGAAPERLRALVDELQIGWARGNPVEIAKRLAAGLPEAVRRTVLQRCHIYKTDDFTEARPLSKVFYAMCKGRGLSIPITDGAGRVVDIAVRRFLGDDDVAAGKPKVLKLTADLHPWGLGAGAGRPLLLVEGEGDRVAVMAATDDVAPVAVGTSLMTESGARHVRRLRQVMRRGGRVYIGLDDDVAGDAAAGPLAVALPGAYVARWGGAKDARDALAAGRLDVAAALAAAVPCSECRPFTVAERPWAWPEMPEHWTMDGGGLAVERWVAKEKAWVWSTVAPLPIWPVALTRDAESGTIDMTVAWAAGGRVRFGLLRRADALSGNVLQLADRGAPITDGNKAAVAKWLLAAEIAWRLPELERVRRLGWHGETLVLGDRCVGPRQYLPSSTDGEMQRVMSAVARRGSREEWRGVIGEAWEMSDLAVFVLSAAAASPFLGRLGVQDSFILHMWGRGRSSVGKTTLGLLALSLWMRPTAGKENWSATATKVESMLAALSAFPLLLDEKGQARSDAGAGSLVYMIGNRRGMGKKPVSNPRFRQAEWHNLVLSTGERMIAGARAFEGQRVRCLEFEEPPFPEGQKEYVERAAAVVERSHGWASDWAAAADLGPWVEKARAVMGERGGAGGRLANLGAAIAAAGANFAHFYGLDPQKAVRIVVQMIEKQVSERVVEGDYVSRALSELMSHVAETRLFYTDAAPAGHRHGTIEHDPEGPENENRTKGRLAIFPARLHRALEELGYDDAAGLTRAWAAAGILEREGRHLQGRVRVKGARQRAYVFPFEGIREYVQFFPPEDLAGEHVPDDAGDDA